RERTASGNAQGRRDQPGRHRHRRPAHAGGGRVAERADERSRGCHPPLARAGRGIPEEAMTESLQKLLADVLLSNDGASEERLATAEEEMDCELPRDVKALLGEHDGGEGTLGPRKRPIELWSIDRIAAECQ